MVIVGEDTAESAVAAVTQLDQSWSNRTMSVCQDILQSLRDGDLGAPGRSAAAGFKQSCGELFPLAKCFSDNVNSKDVVEKPQKIHDIES